MNNLRVHICDLLFHFGYLLLSWANIPFQLLNFIIQNKLKFLKLLCFLFQFINPCHFISYCFFSFLNLFCLWLLLLKIFLMLLFYFLYIFVSMFKLMIFFFQVSLMLFIALLFSSFLTLGLLILFYQILYHSLIFFFSNSYIFFSLSFSFFLMVFVLGF